MTIDESADDKIAQFSGFARRQGARMSVSFCMSDLVNLGDSHRDFFQTLGLQPTPVMTIGQLQELLQQAEGVLDVMAYDHQSDPVVEFLTREILDDLVQQFLPVQ